MNPLETAILWTEHVTKSSIEQSDEPTDHSREVDIPGTWLLFLGIHGNIFLVTFLILFVFLPSMIAFALIFAIRKSGIWTGKTTTLFIIATSVIVYWGQLPQ